MTYNINDVARVAHLISRASNVTTAEIVFAVALGTLDPNDPDNATYACKCAGCMNGREEEGAWKWDKATGYTKITSEEYNKIFEDKYDMTCMVRDLWEAGFYAGRKRGY